MADEPLERSAQRHGASRRTTVARVIGVEEHAWTADLRNALLDYGTDDTVLQLNARPEVDDRLRDVGEDRVAAMDEAAVDVQILSISAPGTQALGAADARPLARDCNDYLADASRRYPDRFAALATLPTAHPAAAGAELERCVTRLNMVGAMLFPHTGTLPIDDDRFEPVFATAARLRVPIYLHPALPPQPVRDVYYRGFDDRVAMVLSSAGWGWHVDAGLAALRLILSGTFDRHPDLQLVLGHWGELLVPFADRVDLLSEVNLSLQRRVIDYIQQNIYVTAGGIYSHRMLTQAIDVMGPDRIMFAADHPYTGSHGRFAGAGGARSFVETAPIGPQDRERLAHGNAERLFGIAAGNQR
jgi:uncharacterized protein